MKKNQSGFGTIEILLAIILIVLIGFAGWFVWHSRGTKSAKGANSTSSTAKTPADTNAGYVVIKEWGVRAKYSGELALSYKIDGKKAIFSSAELTKEDADCVGRGGWINRYSPTDFFTEDGSDGPTVAESAKTNSSLVLVDGYYYSFAHAQSACGQNPDITAPLQNTTNDAVKELVPQLQVVPKA